MTYPSAVTSVDKGLYHELVQSFQLHDIIVSLCSGLFQISIFKANPSSHPVMILDRFLAVFAEFLFNDAQLSFEFRPNLVAGHHKAVEKMCETTKVHVMFGDDMLTVSRAPIVTGRNERTKDSTPPTLSLYFSPDDQTLMEEAMISYQDQVVSYLTTFLPNYLTTLSNKFCEARF